MNIRPICTRTVFKRRRDADYNFPRSMPSNMAQPNESFNMLDGLKFMETQNKNSRHTTTFNAKSILNPVQSKLQLNDGQINHKFELNQSQHFVNKHIDSTPINLIHEQFVDQRSHEDHVINKRRHGLVPHMNDAPKSTRREQYALNNPTRRPLGRTFGIPENNL